MKVDDLEITDEEFITHQSTYNQRTRSMEGRVIVQARDVKGRRYVGERVIRLRLRRQP